MFDLSPVNVPDLPDRTIVVTGAGRGIGAHVAHFLSSKGARVFSGVHGAPDKDCAALLENTTTADLDVTDPAAVSALIDRVTAETGRLDVLINNAGAIAPIGHVDRLETAALREAYEVNTLGLHRMTCAALPLLRASQGVVINAGTGAATTPMEGWAAYCSSKAAARMMTLMFAKDLEGEAVQFFFVGIPPTDTNMQLEIRTAGLNPISKIAKDDLVHPAIPASVMAWLCSAEARQVQDVILDVRDEFFRAMMTA